MNDTETKHILCIEDEQEMIDLIRLILGRRGFDVIGAEGGKEGLEKARQEPPDLILLDLMMPDMDGWEVYQQIKADDKTKKQHTGAQQSDIDVSPKQGFIQFPGFLGLFGKLGIRLLIFRFQT